MPARVLILKIAAIGDVVLAARALREFAQSHRADVRFDWIIDRGLVDLAAAIVGSSCAVNWRPIDARALFAGSKLDQATQSARVFAAACVARPQCVVYLHRDARYRILLAPFSLGRAITIPRSRENELAVYQAAFERLADRIGASRVSPAGPRRASPSKRQGRVGVLIGGASNQKVVFREKRWPALPELVRLLVSETTQEVVLFGGPEDVALADAILASVGSTDRVKSRVGRIALAETPRELAALDSFVSIDSGLAHVAAAVMTQPHQKIVTLFGPTDPGQWAPTPSGQAQALVICKSPSCAPCYRNEGAFNPCRFEGDRFQHCMTSIDPREVLNALK